MATTINLANVSIGFDISKLQKGTEFSRAELKSLSKSVYDSISPIDTYNTKLAQLEKAYNAGAISADRMKQAVSSLRDKYGMNASPIGAGDQSGSNTNEVASMIRQYAGLTAVAAGVKKSLSLAATAESSKISLEVMTGSIEKASMLYQGFIDLDRSSPLSRSEFARAAQTLVGYGLAAESTLPALKALSEVSAGNAERFQSLSLAFGQTQAAGRLMGQEVLQMVNAGFNPLQEISRTTGRSMVELKKAMEEGAISASMVEDAFKSATSEGGRFYEMNERLKNSAAGQWAKMQSDVEMLATEIGTNLMPAAKAFMDLMTIGSDGNGGKGGLAWLAENFSVGASSLIYSMTDLDKFDAMMEKMIDANEQEKANSIIRKLTKQEQDKVDKAMAERARKEREELAAIAKKQEEAAKQEEETKKRIADAAKKAADDAERERRQSIEKMIREAEAIEKAVLTPAELLQEQLDRLQVLVEGGAISQSTFERAAKQAEDKAAGNRNPENLSQTIAPALKAGSVEAYKFFLDRNEKIASRAEQEAMKQTKILEKNEVHAKKMVEALNYQIESAVRVVVKGGR